MTFSWFWGSLGTKVVKVLVSKIGRQIVLGQEGDLLDFSKALLTDQGLFLWDYILLQLRTHCWGGGSVLSWRLDYRNFGLASFGGPLPFVGVAGGILWERRVRELSFLIVDPDILNGSLADFEHLGESGVGDFVVGHLANDFPFYFWGKLGFHLAAFYNCCRSY